MEVLQFSDFQKEITTVGLKNPKVKFDFNSVKLAAIPFLNDTLGQSFLWGGSCIGIFYSEFLFPSIIIFGVSWYFFYFHFIGLNICKIDFSNKNIRIKNRIFIFNWLRKIFGMSQFINFSEIKKISYKEGLLLDRFDSGGSYQSRYLLLIESYSDPAITACQFKKKEEAEAVVMILRKFLVSKEKIIA